MWKKIGIVKQVVHSDNQVRFTQLQSESNVEELKAVSKYRTRTFKSKNSSTKSDFVVLSEISKLYADGSTQKWISELNDSSN